jgi:Membrane-associated lipoprotein involved in thiamine biosynthesis
MQHFTKKEKKFMALGNQYCSFAKAMPVIRFKFIFAFDFFCWNFSINQNTFLMIMKIMKRNAFMILALIFVSCMPQKPQKTVIEGLAQGSYYAITYFDSLNRNFSHEIDSIFQLVDNSVSLWNENSILSKVNRNEEVELNSIFVDNFNLSQKAAEVSHGSFDATISPLVTVWGFSNKNGIEVTQAMIDSLKPLVNYQNIRLENGRIIKADPSMSLDFNAIAQGYTSDLIASFLESQGIKNFLIDTGGEIMTKGQKPDGQEWIVGIEKPAENWDSERIVQTRIRLKNKGLVTSGSYRKYVERNGKRYSHTIDPLTGYPVQHNLLSVTVIAENSAWADALASIFMVLGKEKALELITTLDNVEAYFIFSNNSGELESFATQGFLEKVIE